MTNNYSTLFIWVTNFGSYIWTEILNFYERNFYFKKSLIMSSIHLPNGLSSLRFDNNRLILTLQTNTWHLKNNQILQQILVFFFSFFI